MSSLAAPRAAIFSRPHWLNEAGDERSADIRPVRNKHGDKGMRDAFRPSARTVWIRTTTTAVVPQAFAMPVLFSPGDEERQDIFY
jgi:hypothetical protein